MDSNNVLREISNVRQIEGEPRRRWFSNANFDLYVWQSADGEISAFQLAYDKQDDERIVSWQRDRGLTHAAVDGGEARRDGPFKGTPILVGDGDFDPTETITRLRIARGGLDSHIFAFVATTLANHTGIALPSAGWTELNT